MSSPLPHLEPILIAFLKATLPAWRRFSAEFKNCCFPSPPPTIDANESLLGGWRVHSRTRGSTAVHFSAQAAYHLNNTEEFANAKLDTEEDAFYIMRLARQKAKEDEAAARIAELKALAIITDPEELAQLKKDALHVSPIEPVSLVLKKYIRARPIRPTNYVELQQAIFEAWDAIPSADIDILIDRMPRIVDAVIASNGGHTKY
ncbi:hypothetical protein B0H13DRAFT_2343830 [Mycena leptocephala]|nr:hypothetical protein B0H13DRAFT_2343830 [Mycena leptocephala]